MNIVLDTNVLISAFIARGQCRDVYEHVSLNYNVFISAQIIQEMTKNLHKKFHFSLADTNSVTRLIKENAEYIQNIPKLKQRVSRDKDDDGILALGVLTNADVIISGDRDLLDIKKFRNIVIIRPADFWKFEAVINS